MGLKFCKTSDEGNRQAGLSKTLFMFVQVIGKGGFGKVWRVENKKTKEKFALKEMSKAKIISKKSVPSVMNEKIILTQINHPFLVNMVYSFQDRDNLYLVMDLLTGGDLRYHIGRERIFNEKTTKFFVACIMLSLEYIHSKKIIHRDLKPENLVFDDKGFLRLTDFGIARYVKPENSQDTSGTPGYMAPEVMCRQNHSFAADYFALGVIVYECMLGRRPYMGKNRKEIKDMMMQRNVQIRQEQVPEGWTPEAADFCNQLIQRKQTNRLGYNGPMEVMAHPWLANVNWSKLLGKEERAPFIPPIGDNFDKKHISKPEEPVDVSASLLRRDSIQKQFYGYETDSYSLPPGSMGNNSTIQNMGIEKKMSSQNTNNATNPTLTLKTIPNS